MVHPGSIPGLSGYLLLEEHTSVNIGANEIDLYTKLFVIRVKKKFKLGSWVLKIEERNIILLFKISFHDNFLFHLFFSFRVVSWSSFFLETVSWLYS